jgi:hypothetical protein
MIQLKKNEINSVAIPKGLSFFQDDNDLNVIKGGCGIVLCKLVGRPKKHFIQEDELVLDTECNRYSGVSFEIGDIPSGEYMFKLMFKNNYKYVTIANIQ